MQPKARSALTYLAQVRQDFCFLSQIPISNARTERHILLIKLRAKYGMSYREIATTGIVLNAVLAERNKNMGALLRGVGIWRNMVAFSLSRSHAKGGV